MYETPTAIPNPTPEDALLASVPNPLITALQTRNDILLAAAKARLAEGLFIGPLDPVSKTPMSVVLNPQGYPYSRNHNGLHGFYSATNGPARNYVDGKGNPGVTTRALKAWEDAIKVGVPAANIFVSTETSNRTVLDLDKGLTDEAELIQFCEEFSIPRTRCIRSGRDTSLGAHLYYEGIMESGHFSVSWHGKMITGEIKSKGVYVVGEGSFHKSGSQYSRLWDLAVLPTPVALFTKLLADNKVEGGAAPYDGPKITFDGMSISQERFEECLAANKQDVTYDCYNPHKNRHEYLRVDRCPWEEFHTGENNDSDFAIYFGENGFGVNCVHETCKSVWTVPNNGWQSYKAWMEKENGTLVPFSPKRTKVIIGKKNGVLPNGQGVSGATMPETQKTTKKPFDIGEFSRPAVKGGFTDYIFAPLPDTGFEGWIPLGDVSGIAAPSGGGKTTVVVDAFRVQKMGGKVFGHSTHGYEYLILLADRGVNGNKRTLKRMGIDPDSIPLDTVTGMGQDALLDIKKKVEACPTIPKALFIEGADLLVGNPNDPEIVAPFLSELGNLASHYHIGLLLSLGSPKTKVKEGYVAKRDKILGAGAWGRKLETVILLEYAAGDDMSDDRIMSVLPRNAKSEQFYLIFKDGLLVEKTVVVKPVEPVHDWAMKQKGWFSVKDVMKALDPNSPNLKTVRERLENMYDGQLLKRDKGKSGVHLYAVKGAV
jgi:hypothetical protein